MSIGTLIVGLGQIGMGYDLGLNPESHVCSHARAFNIHPAFHLLGGVDTEEQQRRGFEREYHYPAFADVETALVRVQPELIVIAVPTPSHGEVLRRAFKLSRPVAILCEKPLSYDLEEARAMVNVCAGHGSRLFVNYMRRSDPGVASVKRRLDSGEIGSPVKGVVWYSKGLMHNGSHFFNLLEYWLGGMVDANVLAAGRLWDGSDSEPDVRVSFQRGTVVFLAAREEEFPHYTVELVAPNGRLRYEKGGKQIDWQPARKEPSLRGRTVLAADVETIASGMNRYQWHVADQLATALAGKEARICDGDEALRTLESLRTIVERR